MRTKITKNIFTHAGLFLLLSGIAYYYFFRAQPPWLEPGLFHHQGVLAGHDLTAGTYPSFIFALAFGLLAIGLFWPNRERVLCAIFGIWLIGAIHELTLGTFDLLDLLAGSVGAILAVLVLRGIAYLPTREPVLASQNAHRPDTWKMVGLLFTATTMATGTSPYSPIERCAEYENGECVERTVTASPVYLSYQDLRSAVNVTAPRDMSSVSRIYLYKNWLFINEKNEGIHIIDNSVPSNPEKIGFIVIPGNNEISIRADNLYADSYIDLVTLDVSDVSNIVEVAREEDIFPYDSRQNIPANVRFVGGSVDRTRGVVVGYR